MAGFHHGPRNIPGEFDPPDYEPPPPPKPQQSDATDYHGQTSESGKALPIVYGTERVPAQLIERFSYIFHATEAGIWVPSMSVAVGDFHYSNGNLYVYTQAGVTSSSGSAGNGPSGTGTGITDGTAVCSYAQMGYRHYLAFGFCEGQVYGPGKVWVDKTYYANYQNIPHDAFWVMFHLGQPTGDRPGITYIPQWFPTPLGDPNADIYSNTSTLFIAYVSGQDQALQNLSMEIAGIFCDATHVDVNPADIMVDLLTHARRGVNWPAARVDSVSTGSGAASWRTYCTAYGINLSWSIDSQQSALDLVRQLLLATNTDAVWTNRLDGLGGMLKFVPLGDQPLTANGVTFTPNSTPVYNLTNKDFMGEIEVERIRPVDVFNTWPVEYTDRTQDYRRIIVDDPEMADVDRRGMCKAAGISLPMVMDQSVAMMLSRIFAQRSVAVRNRYRFRLPWRFLLLEPTDIVTISDNVTGLTNQAVRIIAMEEDQSGDGSFVFTAEDWPANVAVAAKYTTGQGDGYKPQIGSPVQALQVLPVAVPTGSVSDDTTTRGGLVDNIFPNPTSETAPPDGADKTKPEWVGRVQSAVAFAGGYVRQLNATQHGAVACLGDAVSFLTGGDEQDLAFIVPCAPGDSFYHEAMAKVISGSASDGIGVYMWFLDANGNNLATTLVGTNQTISTSWTKVSVRGTAPAGAVNVALTLFAKCANGAVTAHFDTVYSRRQIDRQIFSVGALSTSNYAEDGSGNPTAGAKLDSVGTALKLGPANLQISTYTFDDGSNGQFWGRLKNALQNVGSDYWYAGSNSVGGVPDLQPSSSGGGAQMRFEGCTLLTSNNEILVHVQVEIPKDVTRNLDAIRRAELQWYDATPAQKWITRHVAPDQGHSASADNTLIIPCVGILFNMTTGVTATGSYVTPAGYVRLILWNVYGFSAAKDFDCRATNNIAPSGFWPVLTSGIGGGGTPGGGGGGGGLCPAPYARIRLASGLWVHASDLHDGMKVAGFDEFDPTTRKVGIVRKPTRDWQERYELALNTGRVVSYSKGHRFVTPKGWQAIDKLRAGDRLLEVSGATPAVKEVRKIGRAEVIAFQVEGCSTYFSDDLASHNFKP